MESDERYFDARLMMRSYGTVPSEFHTIGVLWFREQDPFTTVVAINCDFYSGYNSTYFELVHRLVVARHESLLPTPDWSRHGSD